MCRGQRLHYIRRFLSKLTTTTKISKVLNKNNIMGNDTNRKKLKTATTKVKSNTTSKRTTTMVENKSSASNMKNKKKNQQQPQGQRTLLSFWGTSKINKNDGDGSTASSGSGSSAGGINKSNSSTSSSSALRLPLTTKSSVVVQTKPQSNSSSLLDKNLDDEMMKDDAIMTTTTAPTEASDVVRFRASTPSIGRFSDCDEKKEQVGDEENLRTLLTHNKNNNNIKENKNNENNDCDDDDNSTKGGTTCKEKDHVERTDKEEDGKSTNDNQIEIEDDEEEYKEDGPNCRDDADDVDSNENKNEANDDTDECFYDEDGYKLSEYEILRLRNIQRNQKRLQQLGLLTTSTTSSSIATVASRESGKNNDRFRKRPKKRAIASSSTPPPSARPTRRSRRLLIDPTNSGSDNKENRNSDETNTSKDDAIGGNDVASMEEEVEEQYEISPLFQYTMSTNSIAESSLGDENNDDCIDSHENRDHHDGSDSDALQADEEDKNLQFREEKMKKTNLKLTLEPVTTEGCSSNSASLIRATGGPGAIYSLQFLNNHHSNRARNDEELSSLLLLGAGKGGIVSLWDCNYHNCRRQGSEESSDAVGEGEILPMVSWKAHGGRWICDAQFINLTTTTKSYDTSLASTCSTSLFVATAANDGTVCLWDMNQRSCTTHVPKLIHQTSKLLHSKGIFSMDVARHCSGLIATGSKDKTVAVTNMFDYVGGKSSKSSSPVLWRSSFHSSKVSSVQWQKRSSDENSGGSSSLLASASDDGLIAIHDMRTNGGESTSPLVIENSHSRPHSVVWEPCAEYGLLTAGMDSSIYLWDIRYLKEPKWSFQGHVPTFHGKLNRIHHPTFYQPSTMTGSKNPKNSYILTGGQGSHSLTMFHYERYSSDSAITSTATTGSGGNNKGTVYSRGKLPADYSNVDVGCIAVSSSSSNYGDNCRRQCSTSTPKRNDGHVLAASTDGGDILLLSPKFS